MVETFFLFFPIFILGGKGEGERITGFSYIYSPKNIHRFKNLHSGLLEKIIFTWTNRRSSSNHNHKVEASEGLILNYKCFRKTLLQLMKKLLLHLVAEFKRLGNNNFIIKVIDSHFRSLLGLKI